MLAVVVLVVEGLRLQPARHRQRADAPLFLDSLRNFRKVKCSGIQFFMRPHPNNRLDHTRGLALLAAMTVVIQCGSDHAVARLRRRKQQREQGSLRTWKYEEVLW